MGRLVDQAAGSTLWGRSIRHPGVRHNAAQPPRRVDRSRRALEFFAFMNVAGAAWFYRLNQSRSSLRYLVPILASGEPVAATFIFSFSEVFARFENMSGGVADTLLALVWTQYQYLLFPIIVAWMAVKLLLEDLHFTWFGTHG